MGLLVQAKIQSIFLISKYLCKKTTAPHNKRDPILLYLRTSAHRQRQIKHTLPEQR